jgi:hypothetical protein
MLFIKGRILEPRQGAGNRQKADVEGRFVHGAQIDIPDFVVS